MNILKQPSFYIRKTALLAGIVLMVLFINKYIMIRTVVEGYSMYPTLYDQDNVVIRLFDKTYERYDIVTVEASFAKTGYIIKRIIGLPGENVFISKDGFIYINGQILEEQYGSEKIKDAGRAGIPGGVLLGEDEYFVMGDNRNHSEDSRFETLGSVKASSIYGIATLRLTPLSRFGFIDLYRERKEESKNK